MKRWGDVLSTPPRKPLVMRKKDFTSEFKAPPIVQNRRACQHPSNGNGVPTLILNSHIRGNSCFKLRESLQRSYNKIYQSSIIDEQHGQPQSSRQGHGVTKHTSLSTHNKDEDTQKPCKFIVSINHQVFFITDK